jgi:hypothetical protein
MEKTPIEIRQFMNDKQKELFDSLKDTGIAVAMQMMHSGGELVMSSSMNTITEIGTLELRKEMLVSSLNKSAKSIDPPALLAT